MHFAVLYDRMQHAIARDQTDDLLCDGSFGRTKAEPFQQQVVATVVESSLYPLPVTF